MALEAYTSQITDEIRTDVLTKARISCYKARDAFYSCLEKESNKKPTEIATVGLLYPVDCKKTRQEYVKQCRPTWARDAFYSCLEKESNKKPTEIAIVGLLYPVDCKKTRQEYVKQCRPTWVKHFDRQYCSKKKV